MGTETPGQAAGCGVLGAMLVGGVIELGVGHERDGGLGSGLPVGCLSLDHGQEDVLGVGELVLVEDIVFGLGSVEPVRSFSGFDEHTTAGVDGDLGLSNTIVQIVVSSPGPDVLEVTGTGGSNVEEHESALAFRNCSLTLGALSDLEFGSLVTSDTEVRVPDTGSSLARSLDVPFDEGGSGLGSLGTEHNVNDFDGTGLSWLTNAEHGLWVGFVLEGFSAGHEHGPELTDDSGSGRNGHSLANHVGTVGEVHDLSVDVVIDHSLDGGRIISGSVSSGSEVYRKKAI